jgi:hypothetical protein
VLTKGLGRPDCAAQRTGDEYDAEFGKELLQRSSGFWIQSRRCGDVLRRSRGSQANRRATSGEKLHGGRAHLRWMSDEFPVRRGPGSMAAGSGRFLVLRRSSGEDPRWMWCSGVAGPRRRRGCCATEWCGSFGSRDSGRNGVDGAAQRVTGGV